MKDLINLKMIREVLNLSVGEFVNILGISHKTLHNYENDIEKCPTTVLIKLSEKLEIPLSFLIGTYCDDWLIDSMDILKSEKDFLKKYIENKKIQMNMNLKNENNLSQRKFILNKIYGSLLDDSSLSLNKEEIKTYIESLFLENENCNSQKLKSLSEKEMTILKLRYGIDNGKIHTLKEIGEHLGISKQAVEQNLLRILKKLHINY